MPQVGFGQTDTGDVQIQQLQDHLVRPALKNQGVDLLGLKLLDQTQLAIDGEVIGVEDVDRIDADIMLARVAVHGLADEHPKRVRNVKLATDPKSALHSGMIG